MNNHTDGRRERRIFRSLLFPIYLPSLLLFTGTGALLPVIPLYARELGAVLVLIGLIIGLRGVGVLVSDIPSGFLASRFGDRRIMAAGMAGNALVGALGVFTRSVVSLSVLVFLLGLMDGMVLLARLNYIRKAAPLEVRGRALSALGGINRIGFLIGPLLGGLLGKFLGLRYVFLLHAVLSGGACLLLFAFLTPLPSEDEAAKRRGDSGSAERFTPFRTIALVVRNHRRAFLTAGVALLVLQVLRAGREILIPLWGDKIGLDVSQIGIIFGLSSAIDMTLFYPAGWIMDHLGRKVAALSCILFMVLGLAFIPLTHSWLPFLLVCLLLGFGNGLGSGINMTFGADYAPRERSGEFFGVWRIMGDIGTTASPLIIGAVAQAVSLGLSSVLTGGIGVLGLLLMLFGVRETLERRNRA
jgi:MFS family permease